MRFKIVETDNFNGDYPDEKFVNLPALPADRAKILCDQINLACNPTGQGNRYWIVRPEDYQLQPGFEP